MKQANQKRHRYRNTALLIVIAASLDASMDISSATALLERFENDHTVSGLTVIDRGGQALYGPENAHLLKGIPEEFAAKVAVDGFEMSAPPD